MYIKGETKTKPSPLKLIPKLFNIFLMTLNSVVTEFWVSEGLRLRGFLKWLRAIHTKPYIFVSKNTNPPPLFADVIYRQSPMFLHSQLKQLFSHLMQILPKITLHITQYFSLVTVFTKPDKFDWWSLFETKQILRFRLDLIIYFIINTWFL